MGALRTRLVGIVLVIAVLIVGCGPGAASPASPPVSSPSAESPASPTSAPEPTPSAVPTPGKRIILTSTDDSGAGSLRQVLRDAQPGDIITFDPAVFPPDAPATISVITGIDDISQGYLTIDASDAGVILDGSQLPRDSWTPGLQLVSDGNTIRGLQVINFTGAGIVVAFHGRNNTIGGDRNIGAGPTGQGNLTSGNDYGIGLWDEASNNVVTGNLVGTDPTGASGEGNRRGGFWIADGAMDNIIGPDNLIAYNGGAGIEVEGSDTFGNQLTQNSIHDNSGAGIALWRGGNARLSAPDTSDVDLEAGRLVGTACPGCAVEVFSDAGNQGATYEGLATADGNGQFTFDQGAAFAGANVTTTATDSAGNTSGFSLPVGTGFRALVLQEGNGRPKAHLVDQPSGALPDNRMGISYAGGGLWSTLRSGNGLQGTLEQITDLGMKRVDTSLYEIEPPIDWSPSETEIPGEFDDFIDDLGRNGIAVDYVLHYWDKEGHALGQELSAPRFKTQEQIDRYGQYAKFIADHFKGRIQYYSLWSEPDNNGAPIKYVEPADYINMARQVIPMIREADPQARIVLAPNVLFFARDYLDALLHSDVIALFDVVSWHGMYDVAPNSFYGDYYYRYPQIVQQIKETASAHGFPGEYWATELTWCSPEMPDCHAPEQQWPVQESDLVAAKYFARGIVQHLGMDLGVGIAGFQPEAAWTYPTIRHLTNIMAGARPIDLAARIDTQAPRLESYGFSLPNGDRLFAFWTNGKPVEDDPGSPVTITFTGLSAQSGEGIDVLYGVRQPLTMEIANGGVVIPNIMLRDYPIFVKLSGVMP